MTTSITRLEVIDETGRVYVRDPRVHGPIEVELSYQDNGETLKVFVRPRGLTRDEKVAIAKTLKEAGDRVRREGPSDGRFRPSKREE